MIFFMGLRDVNQSLSGFGSKLGDLFISISVRLPPGAKY
jgi:hypothetical protein